MCSLTTPLAFVTRIFVEDSERSKSIDFEICFKSLAFNKFAISSLLEKYSCSFFKSESD